MKNTAIVLAGGRGSRMKSETPKQYLLLDGKPVLYYSLHVFQQCAEIDEIILVCGPEDMERCRREIVEKYGFTKVRKIVPGGAQRYHSVYEGLKAAEACRYVLIHDGARPFIDSGIVARILQELPRCNACVAGVPVKDTIKLSDSRGYVEQTIPRERLWTIQTPQAFEYGIIRQAYDALAKRRDVEVKITDDAMVLEYISGIPAKLIEGSYENLKITTPEDLLLAEVILENRKK